LETFFSQNNSNVEIAQLVCVCGFLVFTNAVQEEKQQNIKPKPKTKERVVVTNTTT